MSAGVVRFARVHDDPTDALLTDPERVRRDRLRHPADRRAYVAAHHLVRECAAELLGNDPADVTIVQTCPTCGPGHGRPAVLGVPQLGVSLSHSRSYVAAAAAWGVCGVDVEDLAEDRSADGVMTDRETAWVRSHDDPGRAFTRLWVLKESIVKTGAATLDQLGEVEVLGADGPADDYRGYRLGGWSGTGAVGGWSSSVALTLTAT